MTKSLAQHMVESGETEQGDKDKIGEREAAVNL